MSSSSEQYITSKTHFFENGTVYTDKQGQEQKYKTAYITYTPTDTQHAKNIPLVLVQGWTGVKEDWSELLVGIAPIRPVLVFDNRGMGESSTPPTKYTMNDFVYDTHLLIKHVYSNHNKIHLMGISMGGMIVQSYVVVYPNHVQSLIIGCSHSSARHAIRSSAASQFVSAMSTPPQTREQIIQYVTNVQRFQYTDKWIQNNKKRFEQAIQHSMKYKRPAIGSNGQFHAISKYDVRDKLSSINVPTLVIHGTADQVIAYQNGEVLHKNIKNSELLTLQDVGHIFWNMDNQQAMNKVIEFTNKHDKLNSKL